MVSNDFTTSAKSRRWRTCEVVDPSQVSGPMRCKGMNFCRFISRFLAIFVIVGLVSQPLAAPAAAKRLSVAEMAGVSAMSADMRCCPDDQNKNGCRECPLSSCVLQLAQDQLSYADSGIVRLATGSLLGSPNDLVADGLIGAPPDHPPRILI